MSRIRKNRRIYLTKVQNGKAAKKKAKTHNHFN